jgi:hypothetical protein
VGDTGHLIDYQNSARDHPNHLGKSYLSFLDPTDAGKHVKPIKIAWLKLKWPLSVNLNLRIRTNIAKMFLKEKKLGEYLILPPAEV